MAMCDNCLSTDRVEEVRGSTTGRKLCYDCRTLEGFGLSLDRVKTINGERYIKEFDVIKAISETNEENHQ